jgi:hypothetical protein
MYLPRLRLDTEAKLREATDERDARRMLNKFIASFGDAHLEIEWPKSSAQPNPTASSPQSLWDRLGYKIYLHLGLDFSGLPECSLLNAPEAKLFPAAFSNYETALSLASSGLISSANTPIPRFVIRWYAICVWRKT